MLAVARILMTSPRLVLGDEPSIGLSPIMVETVTFACPNRRRPVAVSEPDLITRRIFVLFQESLAWRDLTM
jgi:hypothetical protein